MEAAAACFTAIWRRKMRLCDPAAARWLTAGVFLRHQLLQVSGLVGALRLEPWNWNITKIWAPVNMIFVGMIGTSFYSLALLGVSQLVAGCVCRMRSCSG